MLSAVYLARAKKEKTMSKFCPDGNERFENLFSFAEQVHKSKTYYVGMPKHCSGDEGLHILKIPSFTVGENANDMQQSIIIKLDMYSSAQTNDLLE